MFSNAWVLWVREMLVRALKDEENRENIILNIINDIDNEFDEINKEANNEVVTNKVDSDKEV